MNEPVGGDEEGDKNDKNDGKTVTSDVKVKQARKKHKIPIRKRLKQKKRSKTEDPAKHLSEENSIDCDESDDKNRAVHVSNILPSMEHDYGNHFSPSSSMSPPSSSLSRPESSLSGCLSVSLPDLSEDNSVSDIASPFSPTSVESCFSPCPQPPATPKTVRYLKNLMLPPDLASDLLLLVRNKLLLMLPNNFTPVVDNMGIHVIMLGRRESKAVQRDIFVKANGDMRIEVHGQHYNSSSILRDVMGPRPLLSEEDTGYFVDRIAQIVNKVRILEICASVDNVEYKDAWDVNGKGVVDCDVYKECRYRETYRSKQCSLLLPTKYWRCKESIKLREGLKRRMESLQKEEVARSTKTRFLSNKQKDKRLESKQMKMKIQLRKRMQELIAKEGVKVEKELSSDLTEILQSANLSVPQSLQQLKAVNCKKS
ncbi:RNA exonuclease 3 [Frankliniella fusca]|uniref:RNA exonuclease 3 n=1 Tax=Frankliniella fusca TaxID=407009 RepID=A0AAE1HEM3_9NEOP|nr:RNA exonuclease 3 [Frankliniella fusca]